MNVQSIKFSLFENFPYIGRQGLKLDEEDGKIAIRWRDYPTPARIRAVVGDNIILHHRKSTEFKMQLKRTLAYSESEDVALHTMYLAFEQHRQTENKLKQEITRFFEASIFIEYKRISKDLEILKSTLIERLRKSGNHYLQSGDYYVQDFHNRDYERSNLALVQDLRELRLTNEALLFDDLAYHAVTGRDLSHLYCYTPHLGVHPRRLVKARLDNYYQSFDHISRTETLIDTYVKLSKKKVLIQEQYDGFRIKILRLMEEQGFKKITTDYAMLRINPGKAKIDIEGLIQEEGFDRIKVFLSASQSSLNKLILHEQLNPKNVQRYVLNKKDSKINDVIVYHSENQRDYY
ncbi:hypothetical protein [Geomicrobium sediminis]|uniref:Uncharacterized protein n=1 Tax=Geomicrobium sediminis TaxID=1347788 RepID=A0ABS2PFU4_9BACL|nr:hypothetical protein [Geomicrobium sediminis]MBM7634199.1 hypothetical protein [Geomicrobium sediminis]